MKSDEGVVPDVVPSGCWSLKAEDVNWLSIKFFERLSIPLRIAGMVISLHEVVDHEVVLAEMRGLFAYLHQFYTIGAVIF